MSDRSRTLSACFGSTKRQDSGYVWYSQYARYANVTPGLSMLPSFQSNLQDLRTSRRSCIPRACCMRTTDNFSHFAQILYSVIRTRSMARTKFIPKPRPSQPTKRTTSSNTGRRAAWTAAIELGASNGQALVEKPGGTWELVRWPQGAGASSVGGAEAIPALTAIQKGQRESREICHGHAAVRARKKDPTDWEVFAYPKHVFMDGDTTPEIQRTLELQEEKAKTLGTTPREIAIGFFRHMISEVVGSNEGTFKIYLNISDRWRNRPVQELMLSLEALKANVYFENVDECLSTLVGRISNKESDLQTGEVVVVVDCGHSTMVRIPLGSAVFSPTTLTSTERRLGRNRGRTDIQGASIRRIRCRGRCDKHGCRGRSPIYQQNKRRQVRRHERVGSIRVHRRLFQA